MSELCCQIQNKYIQVCISKCQSLRIIILVLQVSMEKQVGQQYPNQRDNQDRQVGENDNPIKQQSFGHSHNSVQNKQREEATLPESRAVEKDLQLQENDQKNNEKKQNYGKEKKEEIKGCVRQELVQQNSHSVYIKPDNGKQHSEEAKPQNQLEQIYKSALFQANLKAEKSQAFDASEIIEQSNQAQNTNKDLQVNTGKQELDRLQGELENLAVAYSQLKIKYEKQIQHQAEFEVKTQMQSQIQKQQILQLKKQLGQLRKKNINFSQQSAEYQRLIKILQSKYLQEKKEKELQIEHVEELLQKIQKLNDQKAGLQDQKETIKQELQKNIQSSCNKNKTYEFHLSLKVKQNQKMSALQDKLEKTNFDLQSQLSQLQKKSQKYKIQNQYLTTEFQKLQSALQDANSHLLQHTIKSNLQFQEKNCQISRLNVLVSSLQLKVKDYQKFKQFKLKEQFELEQLITHFRSISAQPFNKASAQYKLRYQQIILDNEQIRQAMGQDAKRNISSLNSMEQRMKQSYQKLNLFYQSRLQISGQQIKKLTQDNSALKEHLTLVEQSACETLNNCYEKIDSLREQINAMQSSHSQKQHSWQMQKQQLGQTTCEFARHIQQLQNELEKAVFKGLELTAGHQVQLYWLYSSLKSRTEELDQVNNQKQLQVGQLRAELQALQEQLRTSQTQASNRQKSIVESFCSSFSKAQLQKHQLQTLAAFNQNLLIEQFKNTIQMNDRLAQMKENQKDRKIQYHKQKYHSVVEQFERHQQCCQKQLKLLSDAKDSLVEQKSTLENTNKAKKMIQEQYAAKQELLNNILYSLGGKKVKITWQQVIKHFADKDVQKLFEPLTDVLCSAISQFQKTERQFTEINQELVQLDRKYAILEKANVQIKVCNMQLEQKIMHCEAKLKGRQTELIQYKTDSITLGNQIEQQNAEIQKIKGQVELALHEKNKISRQNDQNKALLVQKTSKIKELTACVKRIQAQKVFKDQDHIRIQYQQQKNQVLLGSNQLQQYKKTNASLTRQLQQLKQLSYAYKEQLAIFKQKAEVDSKISADNQFNKKQETFIKKDSNVLAMEQKVKSLMLEIKGLKSEVAKLNNQREELNDVISVKNFEIKELDTGLKAKEGELTSVKQKLRVEIAQRQKAQAQKQEYRHHLISPISLFSPESASNRSSIKSPLKLQIRDSPIPTTPFVIADNVDNTFKNQGTLFQNSEILSNALDETFLKNMVEKFTSKKLVSSNLKFKMQPNKLDYNSEVKDINNSSFAWLFKGKDNTIFGAASFSKQATMQQSVILFNLSSQTLIEPSSNKSSSWTPIKTDSFYLTFGVQQARYIWKSKIFSIIDSKSSLKYFDPNKPLMPTLLKQEKNEVVEFQVYLLNISK